MTTEQRTRRVREAAKKLPPLIDRKLRPGHPQGLTPVASPLPAPRPTR